MLRALGVLPARFKLSPEGGTSSAGVRKPPDPADGVVKGLGGQHTFWQLGIHRRWWEH